MTQKPHMIVIDKDREIIELIEAFFRPRGFSVSTFSTPEDAVRMLGEPSNTKIILADVNLLKAPEFDLIKRSNEIAPDVAVIIMADALSAASVIENSDFNLIDLVLKPIHLPQLNVSVQRALQLGQMREENKALRFACQSNTTPIIQGVIAKSEAFRQIMDLANRVSKSTANVFITGESGTGKEVIARAIHNSGNRKERPFVAINCSAIPESLLESELFGYGKGAFTGATDRKIGLFEEANGGSLFLDEIGDLSLPLQAKLLRVLQDHKIRRLGETNDRTIDVRFIAATHKDILDEVRAGRFREDLFYRLNVIPIHIPPLRERIEDILPLAEFFLRKYAALNRSQARRFSKDAIEHMLAYPWYGNVRELENAIERSVVLSEGDSIRASDFPVATGSMSASKKGREVKVIDDQTHFSEKIMTLDELTKRYIQFALEQNRGVKERTAQDLGIDRKTLYRKLQEIRTANPKATD